jgi:histidine triad (HIT) family protein
MASIFTKIIRNELPADRVFETESELAFLDINPKSEGHTLVVPKLEVPNFEALPLPNLQSLAATLQLVTRGVIRATGTPHYNLSLNNGGPAGQVVFHVHFHIIPRYEGGRGPLAQRPYREGRMADVAERIREAIKELEN